MFTGTSRLFYSGLYTCAPTRMLAWRAKPQEGANAGTRAEISYSKPFKTKTHFCVRAKVLLLCNARRSWRLKTWLRLKNVRCWLRSYIFNRQKKRNTPRIKRNKRVHRNFGAHFANFGRFWTRTVHSTRRTCTSRCFYMYVLPRVPAWNGVNRARRNVSVK